MKKIVIDLTYWKSRGFSKTYKETAPTLLAQGGGTDCV